MLKLKSLSMKSMVATFLSDHDTTLQPVPDHLLTRYSFVTLSNAPSHVLCVSTFTVVCLSLLPLTVLTLQLRLAVVVARGMMPLTKHNNDEPCCWSSGKVSNKNFV